jgi:hypothetical protein
MLVCNLTAVGSTVDSVRIDGLIYRPSRIVSLGERAYINVPNYSAAVVGIFVTANPPSSSDQITYRATSGMAYYSPLFSGNSNGQPTVDSVFFSYVPISNASQILFSMK